MQADKKYLGNEVIETIYFGGGTPSLMHNEDIQKIINEIYLRWEVMQDAEITLEANPDDLNDNALAAWKNSGINRLSIGIQSLYDDELSWMNRAHNGEEALNALGKARQAGFRQLTADFIYGSPLMTDERWRKTLQWIAKEEIPHISCYALTVEPRTPLAKKKRTHNELEIENEKQGKQFIMLMEAMHKSGYEHYEISNFALTGQRSRHNTAYWHGKHYLGIGPSAHSFNGKSRQWNIASNTKYIQSIDKNLIPAEIEILSNTQKINEYLLTHLRLQEGCSKKLIAENYGEKYLNTIETALTKYQQKGQLIITNEGFFLTNEGKLFADAIAGDLFFSEKISQTS
jgi:oxygen-independent coproporphyrinogen-3 oxidase